MTWYLAEAIEGDMQITDPVMNIKNKISLNIDLMTTEWGLIANV